jgi:small-conductance mechanosensitive channel
MRATDAGVYSGAMSRARPVRAALVTLALAASVMLGIVTPHDAHAAVANDDSIAGPTPATLVIAERPVFVFRDSIGTVPPAERRDRAERVIHDLIVRLRPDSMRIDATPHGNRLSYGAAPLFTITAGDVDTLAGQSLDGVTREAATAIGAAMGDAMRQRSPRHLIVSGVVSLIATLVFVLLLRLLMGLDDRIARLLIATGQRQLGRLTAKGVEVIRHERLVQSVRATVHSIGWLLSLLLTYVWLTFVLRRFPWTAPLGETLRSVLWNSVKGVTSGLVAALPGLITVTVIVLLTRFASRILALVFVAVERGTLRVPWIHPDTAIPTRRIAITVLWLFAFMAAYPYIPGSDTAVFKGASVLIGALLSFGSSGIVSQAMNGFVLMYSRAFKKGEFIHVAEVVGTVSEVGLLSTKIVTPRNEEVTIPNSLMVGSITTNDSRLATEQGLYLNTTVTIGYEAPWRQVHALLIEAARRTGGLRREPAPFVMQRSLSTFGAEYVLAAQIEEPARRMRVLAELHQNIQDMFNEYGVQIMLPSYENERSLGPPMVPKSKWWTPPAERPETGPAAADPT